MQCNDCCRTAHEFLPFHRIEVWRGSHFEPAWLWQNGTLLPLGHNGAPCPGPDEPMETDINDSDVESIASDPGSDSGWESSDEQEETKDSDPIWGFASESPAENSADGTTQRGSGSRRVRVSYPELPKAQQANIKYPILIIVDISGIHEIPVHYCTCHDIPTPHDSQLLDLGLFPATFKRIRTAFTFQVLDDFRMDNLESKTTAYQYYNKLRRVTNPAFPSSVQVSILYSQPYNQ